MIKEILSQSSVQVLELQNGFIIDKCEWYKKYNYKWNDSKPIYFDQLLVKIVNVYESLIIKLIVYYGPIST